MNKINKFYTILKEANLILSIYLGYASNDLALIINFQSNKHPKTFDLNIF
jgi:hypothetical protein